MIKYQVFHQDGNARAGKLDSPHGSILTPIFMPVGTLGTVKAATPEELKNWDSDSFRKHLPPSLRPGDELIRNLADYISS